LDLERCPGSGSLVALGHKHSGREYAGCPVCLGPIELVPNPPGQANPWGIVADHERLRPGDPGDDPVDPWPEPSGPPGAGDGDAG
jgi:hypothetical protein